jgi:acetyl coenzyme A synthetase (ADP forming)-like protein
MEKKRMLSEDEGYQLLSRFGIPVPVFELVSTAEEAREAAERIGYPVVLKIKSRQVIHKSDVGGVVRHIGGREELRLGFDKILESIRKKVPGAVIEGIVVESEQKPGIELFIGGKTDPSFGRVISFGTGGTAIELFPDFSLRILPISRDEIPRLIREIRGYPLIAGYRGAPPGDEKQLINCIERAIAMFESDAGIEEFDINPLILYEDGACAVDARIYYRSSNVPPSEKREDFDFSLLRPETIAVIGASPDPAKIGYSILRNLLSFPGRLYPVNPAHDEILGKKTYHSVGAIPEPIDLAVIVIPAHNVPSVLGQAADRGARMAVIISSGFREIGTEGAEIEQEILSVARKSRIRIIGPNCLGVVLPYQLINTTFDPTSPRKGHIAFISQSGAIITTIIDWSVPEEIGFSAVISLGNQIDLDFIDFLRFAAGDDETRAIILYIEEIKDGSSFITTVREITRNKPVIILKSGSSALGKKAASSHTGSLAGDFEVYMAAFRQAGAVPVYSLREAFDVAELLVSEGYPKGNRAVVITTAGGFAVLISDYADRFGIDLPPLPPELLSELDSFLPHFWNRSNPLDIIGDGGADRYARVLDTLIRYQDFWDIAVIVAVPSAVLDPTILAHEITRFSRHTQKMVVGCLLGGDTMKGGLRVLRHHHIPNYEDIESLFKAVGRTLRVSGHRKQDRFL